MFLSHVRLLVRNSLVNRVEFLGPIPKNGVKINELKIVRLFTLSLHQNFASHFTWFTRPNRGWGLGTRLDHMTCFKYIVT